MCFLSPKKRVGRMSEDELEDKTRRNVSSAVFFWKRQSLERVFKVQLTATLPCFSSVIVSLAMPWWNWWSTSTKDDKASEKPIDERMGMQ